MKTYREERLVQTRPYESIKIVCEEQGDDMSALTKKVTRLLNNRENEIRDEMTNEALVTAPSNPEAKPDSLSDAGFTYTAPERLPRKAEGRFPNTEVPEMRAAGVLPNVKIEAKPKRGRPKKAAKTLPLSPPQADEVLQLITAEATLVPNIPTSVTYADLCTLVTTYLGKHSELRDCKNKITNDIVGDFGLKSFIDLKNTDDAVRAEFYKTLMSKEIPDVNA